MLTLREKRRQYTFPTRDQAEVCKPAIVAGCRVQGSVTLRKSLPEFRHHGNPGWSVYVQAWAMPDDWEIAALAKKHGGRTWGDVTERTPDTVTELRKHVDDQNIESLLFKCNGEYRVRVRDLDAGENVSLVICADWDTAEAKYREAVSA